MLRTQSIQSVRARNPQDILLKVGAAHKVVVLRKRRKEKVL